MTLILLLVKVLIGYAALVAVVETVANVLSDM